MAGCSSDAAAEFFGAQQDWNAELGSESDAHDPFMDAAVEGSASESGIFADDLFDFVSSPSHSVTFVFPKMQGSAAPAASFAAGGPESPEQEEEGAEEGDTEEGEEGPQEG